MQPLGLARSPSGLVLGTYLIVGGGAGLDSIRIAVASVLEASPAGLDSAAVLLWSAITGLFAIVFASGILLLFDRRHAWTLAALALGAQCVMGAWPHGGYVFSTGVFAGVLVESGSWAWMHGWAVRAEIATESARTFFGINFAPAALYLLAFRLRRFRPQRTKSDSPARQGNGASDSPPLSRRRLRFLNREEE